VRFTVSSETAQQGLWLTELRTARMGELDWYLIRGNGVVEHLVAGNLRERSPEMVDCKYPVFPLRLAAGGSAEVFLRIHSETAMYLPLQIWEPGAFASAQAGSEAVFATFFGYLAALILMSLAFSLFTRDRGYVIYSLSLLGVFGLFYYQRVLSLAAPARRPVRGAGGRDPGHRIHHAADDGLSALLFRSAHHHARPQPLGGAVWLGGWCPAPRFFCWAPITSCIS